MNTFERNIKSLITLNASLGTRLFAIDGNERYEVFQDPNDPLNVNIYDHRNDVIFYEGQPQDEILAQVDRFEQQFSRYPVLFIYGIANALFVKLLLQNINHTHIIVIEPEIELLYIALNLIDFSTEITKKRVHFFENHEIDFVHSVGIFSDSQIKVFCKTYHLEPNTSYYEQYYGELLLQCNANMIRAIHHVVTGLGNDTTDALIGLEWHLANISKMVETPTLQDLIKKVKTTKTAIIVSTGPSLAKQLPLLMKIKDHVTLLSVDASLPILEQYDIKPDVVFSIERVPMTAEFYRRTSRAFQEGIVCAISSISHPVLVDSVNGAIMQMSMRPFGYTRYFGLPEYGYVGIGMSAANMAYEVAYHARFETIILIGQDLAYGENGQSHSDGHILHTIKSKESDFYIEAYGGNGTVRTSILWDMFRNFYENDIQIANNEGIVTVNATEGGARIHGAIELPFVEAIEYYINKAEFKERIILEDIPAEQILKNNAKVEYKLTYMQEYVTVMQKKVSSLFEKVAKCVEALDKTDAKNNLGQVDYDYLGVLMEEIDQVKSKFDDQEFIDIFIDATQAMIVHHELDLARIQVRPILTDDDRRLKMIDWIYAHKAWLFSLAGIMEAERVVIERRGADAYIIRDVQVVANRVTGYIFDLENITKIFEVDLVIDGEAIAHTKAQQQLFHHLLDKPGIGRFNFEIPERLFDNHVHTIVVKESSTGMFLSSDLTPMILLEAYKIHGVIYEKSKVSYHGWCKKIASEDKQQIDIFIDDKYVDTIVSDGKVSEFEYLFEDQRFGFEFVVPETFFDDMQHIIRFTPKDALLALEGGEHSFNLGQKDIGKQREALFLESLDHIDTKKIKNLYYKDSIGLLAVEENLNDQDFVNYIKELMAEFSNAKFKVFYFTDEQKKRIEVVFENVYDSLEVSKLNSIYDMVLGIEVYLSNYERTYVNQVENRIVKVLRKYSTDVACIGLGLNQQNTSVRQHEMNNPSYFSKIFDNLEYLGFSEDDINKYGKSYNEIYFKKASEKYGLDIDFNFDEIVSKAYVYWNLKLGLKHHEFFQYALDFGRKYTGIQ